MKNQIVSLTPHIVVVRVEGKLTVGNLPAPLWGSHTVPEPPDLILDLQRAHSMDQDGLAWLVDLHLETRTHDRQMVLLSPGKEIWDLLGQLEIQESFTVCWSLRDAAEILTRDQGKKPLTARFVPGR
jgi:anti-anti-sigma regulatory factor